MAIKKRSYHFGALVPSGQGVVLGLLMSCCAGLVGLMGFMGYEIYKDGTTTTLSEAFEEVAAENSGIEFMGNDYRMRSPHTLSAKYAGKNYVYDFLTRTVTIDGDNDDFDRLLLFSEMDDPQLIGNITAIACNLSHSRLNAAAAFRAAHGNELSEEANSDALEAVDTYEADARMFITEFCPTVQ